MRIADQLFAVIVNWRLPDDTLACITSLIEAGMPPHHIIVVDNGAGEQPDAGFYGRLPAGVGLLPQAQNLGFAAGNNQAIRLLLLRGAEWVLLINNDTFVAPDFLKQLESAAAARPEWRIVAPLILYAGEPQRIWSLGDKRVAATLITRSLHRNRLIPPQLTPLIEVDFLNACALMVHRSVFERVGLFDESFFMYAEDADFCQRATAAGLRLGCATKARIWHKVSLSTGAHHPQARYWRVANQIRFYRTHSHGVQRVVMFGFSTLRSLRLAASDLAHRRAHLAQTTLRAWQDGWFCSAAA